MSAGACARTEEGHEDETPGIERREGDRDRRHQEAVDRRGTMRAAGIGRLDDRVLRDEAGEADIRMRNADARQRQRADRHHPEGEGNVLPQAAHVAHVLLVMHRMDDRARAEEQQRLEEGVREQVEDAEAVAADAERDEHVAKLRTGRIGDDALDVVLHEADRRGEERRRRADHRHDGERRRREFEQRRQPRHHEDAGRHHRRGMDERRDGRRAFHRVRQPGVQQELRRLAHRAHEQAAGR